MKLLILSFIFSVSALAQYKVEIINYENREMSQECKTKAKCREYIARVEHKWGKKQRWQRKPCPKESDLIETRDVVNEIDSFTEYHCKQNYSVSKPIDISEEVDDRAALKEIEKDMAFGKSLYAKIRLLFKKAKLSRAQRKASRKQFSSIREDLFDGDICSARASIMEIEVNPIITVHRKAKTIKAIDKYTKCE